MAFCVNRELDEFVNKLTTVKKMGFFFGAGSSMALGMPGIEYLTTEVIGRNENPSEIRRLQEQIIQENEKNPGSKITIEEILNKIRIIRELTKDNANYSYADISGELAKKLDISICNDIYDILSGKEKEIIKVKKKFIVPMKFFVWLNNLNLEKIKEIFTVNYDLIFEQAMENLGVPYYDGFVGAHKPFFHQQSVEDMNEREALPHGWIRLWKMHGSLGWFWEIEDTQYRVVRLGAENKSEVNNELVIYPSKDKYQSSRKQPFVSYFDRFKNHLSYEEGMFIVSGYSFGDEHINDVIYDSLRKNPRMYLMVFFYYDENLEHIQEKAILYPNMSIFAPTKAIIGGKLDIWEFDIKKLDENNYNSFVSDNKLLLGDFSKLVDFLVENSGRKREILSRVGGSDA